jgi:hypothetical protein
MAICGVKNLLQLQIHEFASVHSSDWGQDFLNKHPWNVQHRTLNVQHLINSFQLNGRYIILYASSVSGVKRSIKWNSCTDSLNIKMIHAL